MVFHVVCSGFPMKSVQFTVPCVCVHCTMCSVCVRCTMCCVLCTTSSLCWISSGQCGVLCCGIRRGVASAPRGGTKTPHLLMLLRTTMMMTMFMMVRMRLYDRYEDETGKRKFEWYCASLELSVQKMTKIMMGPCWGRWRISKSEKVWLMCCQPIMGATCNTTSIGKAPQEFETLSKWRGGVGGGYFRQSVGKC